jgi:hypothetical protein
MENVLKVQNQTWPALYGPWTWCLNFKWFANGGIQVIGWFMVFNATFNNILVISWQSVLLMEETRVPEKTTDLSQVNDIKLLIRNQSAMCVCTTMGKTECYRILAACVWKLVIKKLTLFALSRWSYHSLPFLKQCSFETVPRI